MPNRARRAIFDPALGAGVLVVVSAEVVKADLLFGPACSRRARGLRLERAMHPLVATVFLRRCRTDEMRLDTELEPPRRELGQPAEPARAERRAIVAADRNWQAVAAKRCAEGWPNPIDRRRHDIERDQKAAVVVRYGQGVNARAVSGAKPALEIDTPFVIHDLDSCKWPLLSKRFAPPLPGSDLARLLQDIPNGRGRRPAVLRMAPLQHRHELAGSQMRKPTSQRDDRLHQPRVSPMRTVVRRMRSIHKPMRIAAVSALAPIVERVATHAVAAAQLRHVPVASLVVRKHPMRSSIRQVSKNGIGRSPSDAF